MTKEEIKANELIERLGLNWAINYVENILILHKKSNSYYFWQSVKQILESK